MKKQVLLITLILGSFTYSGAQEFATFTLTGEHQGTGSFTQAVLPDFTWSVIGTLAREIQILDDEIFDDGNQFEATFGQADNAENLRTQLQENGPGTAGQPITSRATMTIDFDEVTPASGWGFCVVDIDVENLLVKAIDKNDNEVPAETVNRWLVELFDANLSENGENLPKWDATHAALLGFNTPDDYTVYDSIVIGGMPDSEAPAAFFQPDIPLKSLILVFENLQDIYKVSYHFYLASESATGIEEISNPDFVIFPNPAGNEFKVQSLPAGQAGLKFKVSRATVEIYDLNGRKLLEKQIPKGTEEFTVDVSHLNSGLYFCRIRTEKGSVTKKLIIQK